MLEVRNISKSFRGLRAVREASFEVSQGSINALIGPNGAGKTTIFNMVAGVYAPDTGEILFEGKRIDGASGPGVRGRDRPHLPARQALRRPLGARQRDRRRASPGTQRFQRASVRALDTGKLNLETKAALPASSSPSPTASAWRSRARSPRGRGCSCSTK